MRSRWVVLPVIALGQLMVVLDSTVMNIALPSAQMALHFSNDERQWIVTGYSLSFGGLLLIGGKLSDMLGRKVTFIVGLTGFAIASAVGGAAQSFFMLAAARAVQGAFAALLAPSALSLLTTTFTTPSDRSKAIGVYGAIAGSGASIGLLLGGTLTQVLDWRAVMYVNVVIAVIAGAGALALLPSHRPGGRPRLDVAGALSVTAGLFAIVFGFSEAETTSWTSVLTLGPLVLGVALLLVFVWLEARTAEPLLPLRILADRNRAAAFLSIFVSVIGLFGAFLFLTYYLQDTLRYDPVTTGLMFLPMTVTLIATSMTAQLVLRPRIGARWLVSIGMAVAALGMLFLTRLGLHSDYITQVMPALLAMGLGLGLVFSTSMYNATLGTTGGDAGVASATVNACQQVGGSIGSALLSTVAINATASYLTGSHATAALVATATVHGYTTAFAWSAAIFAGGALIALLLFRGGRPRLSAASRQAEPAPEPPRVRAQPLLVEGVALTEGVRLAERQAGGSVEVSAEAVRRLLAALAVARLARGAEILDSDTPDAPPPEQSNIELAAFDVGLSALDSLGSGDGRQPEAGSSPTSPDVTRDLRAVLSAVTQSRQNAR
jgi:EmrB/QacA subfamily drug resistance transporter